MTDTQSASSTSFQDEAKYSNSPYGLEFIVASTGSIIGRIRLNRSGSMKQLTRREAEQALRAERKNLENIALSVI